MENTSYVDLEEKERKEKEEGLKLSHIPDVNQDEIDAQEEDPTRRDVRKEKRSYIKWLKESGESRHEAKRIYDHFIDPQEGTPDEDYFPSQRELRRDARYYAGRNKEAFGSKRAANQSYREEYGDKYEQKNGDRNPPVNFGETRKEKIDQFQIEGQNRRQARQDYRADKQETRQDERSEKWHENNPPAYTTEEEREKHIVQSLLKNDHTLTKQQAKNTYLDYYSPPNDPTSQYAIDGVWKSDYPAIPAVQHESQVSFATPPPPLAEVDPVTQPQPEATAQPGTGPAYPTAEDYNNAKERFKQTSQADDQSNSYEEYVSMLDESLTDPVSTKARQDRLSKAAKITSTGEMLNNVIDLIAGGGSNGAPIYRRTDTATPAMLNQLERLRSEEDNRLERYNASKLQNKIRGIQFGQQDENQERISRHFAESNALRRTMQEDSQEYGAEQNKLNREANVKAQEVAKKANKEAQIELEALRLKGNKELDDHRRENAIKEIEARYGADAALVVLKASNAAKGSGNDPNFYVIDDETGETITIPPEQYWSIVQKEITKQGTIDGKDETYNEDFQLSEAQLNSLVAKNWKEHYVQPAQATTTERTNKVTADQAEAVLNNIMADTKLNIVKKRSTYTAYLKANTALTDEKIAEVVGAIR